MCAVPIHECVLFQYMRLSVNQRGSKSDLHESASLLLKKESSAVKINVVNVSTI
jgi:hypothetical protein